MASPPAAKKIKTRRGLEERLAAGEKILCAEGYLLAFTRAGYVSGDVWVPEFVLDYPEVLRCTHYEYVRAGSDVMEAFQYYTHRKRMQLVGKEDQIEQINRTALTIAREIAEETGTLFAGGISNTDLFIEVTDRDPTEEIRAMFEEQVRWSKEEGVDYVIAETISYLKEAKIAVEVIKSFDLPAVVTLAVTDPLAKKDGIYFTRDKVPVAEACQQLLDMGATLVGVNCSQGPATMIDIVEQICSKVPPEKVCALPIAYRTTPEEPIWYILTDKAYPKNNPVYPNGIDAFHVSRLEITEFTKRCMELGLRYVGICCGNTGSYTRAMAEAMGKDPVTNKYHDKSVLAKAKELTEIKIKSMSYSSQK